MVVGRVYGRGLELVVEVLVDVEALLLAGDGGEAEELVDASAYGLADVGGAEALEGVVRGGEMQQLGDVVVGAALRPVLGAAKQVSLT